MYLLDTNICIYIINKKPIKVVEHITKLKPRQIKLSTITLAELEYGVCKSQHRNQNRRALVAFASAFDLVPFDDRDAEVYGLLRADLEKKGRIIGPYDMEIAAQAISRNLTLVSNNTSEFSRIPDLKLENWL